MRRADSTLAHNIIKMRTSSESVARKLAVQVDVCAAVVGLHAAVVAPALACEAPTLTFARVWCRSDLNRNVDARAVLLEHKTWAAIASHGALVVAPAEPDLLAAVAVAFSVILRTRVHRYLGRDNLDMSLLFFLCHVCSL